MIAPHAQVLKLTGGEPTLHPEFAEIIHAVVETCIPFTVFTNARWRKPERVIELLKAAPTCEGVLVSLHGRDAVTHEAFTKTPGSFEQACENIARATGAGLRVHTSTVITRHNCGQASEMVALADRLGAQRAVFNRYLGPDSDEIEPGESQLRAVVADIERLMRTHHRRSGAGVTVRYGNCIPQCFMPSSATGCWAGVAYCTIDPWGNVRPCNHSPTIGGNILTERIKDIWQGETFGRWRELLPNQCDACAKLEVCHGGCRALVEIRSADPLIRRPLPASVESGPSELELYEASRPRLSCTVLEEPFGLALVKGQTIIPVTRQAQPILDYMDGRATLLQIQTAFGQAALDLVGTLYLRGLVTWQEQPILVRQSME